MSVHRPILSPICCPYCIQKNRSCVLAEFDLLGNDAMHIRSTAQLIGFKSRMGLKCQKCGSVYVYVNNSDKIAYVHKEARFVQWVRVPKTSTFLERVAAVLWDAMLWATPKKYFPSKREEVSNTKAPMRIIEIVSDWILVGVPIRTNAASSQTDETDDVLIQELKRDAELDRALDCLSREAQHQKLDDAISEWQCTEGQDRWEARLGATASDLDPLQEDQFKLPNKDTDN